MGSGNLLGKSQRYSKLLEETNFSILGHTEHSRCVRPASTGKGKSRLGSSGKSSSGQTTPKGFQGKPNGRLKRETS